MKTCAGRETKKERPKTATPNKKVLKNAAPMFWVFKTQCQRLALLRSHSPSNKTSPSRTSQNDVNEQCNTSSGAHLEGSKTLPVLSSKLQFKACEFEKDVFQASSTVLSWGPNSLHQRNKTSNLRHLCANLGGERNVLFLLWHHYSELQDKKNSLRHLDPLHKCAPIHSHAYTTPIGCRRAITMQPAIRDESSS